MATSHPEAYAEYLRLEAGLSTQQKKDFHNAVIVLDGDEWHIQAGFDLMRDPFGAGATIEAAVRSFFDLTLNEAGPKSVDAC